ncbi:MAG: pyrroline-5-carboxylate reductase [Sphingomonadaceae bacterium]|nr:pyrroline-5-carboxylate reductase [Sphingomonadaceae bacterium]
MTDFTSILLVGCGNMGGAMLRGWLASGLSPAKFTIVDPQLEGAPKGVALIRDYPERTFDAILLGVKPQMLDAVAGDVAPLAGEGTVILSMLAGVELATLEERFPNAGAYVRVMPNLAASLGKSPVGMAEIGLDAAQREAVAALMDRLGAAEWIDEGQFNLVTALAGSGPGFVYRFIDALASGGAELGLPPETAQRLALAMVEGAAALAAQSPDSPAQLAQRVASPGGTTEAGLKVLDDGAAMTRLVEKTLRAARDRGEELAEAARKQG